MNTHPVRFPRFIFTGPGAVKITTATEANVPRCRQAVLSPYTRVPRQCKKRGTYQEGDYWFCHNRQGLKGMFVN